MRGCQETKNNAFHISRALSEFEFYYQNGTSNKKSLDLIAEILNYDKKQLLDDMHDLYEYLQNM